MSLEIIICHLTIELLKLQKVRNVVMDHGETASISK